MKNINLTRAALILNAIKAPHESFIRLHENFSPDELFKGGETFWQELGLSKSAQARLAKILAKDSWADKELEKIEAFNAKFITAVDIDFPAKLRDLSKIPIGLYVKGSANISLPSIAIAGTRKCSDYGRNTAFNLAKALAQAGITVISGGARGIDAAAHRGSISENGITIAVFGTGIDKTYPSEHKDLFRRILETGGALVSEYPMGSGGEAWRFPERNRIIAALAGRVIIIESPENGGAMLTADYAQKLNRERWTLPGKITDESFKGSNSLLNKGTGALISIEEFITSITGNPQIFIETEQNNKPEKNTIELSDEAKLLYSLIQSKSGLTQDGLLQESKLDRIDLQTALMDLESENLITNAAGRYSAVI